MGGSCCREEAARNNYWRQIQLRRKRQQRHKHRHYTLQEEQRPPRTAEELSLRPPLLQQHTSLPPEATPFCNQRQQQQQRDETVLQQQQQQQGSSREQEPQPLAKRQVTTPYARGAAVPAYQRRFSLFSRKEQHRGRRAQQLTQPYLPRQLWTTHSTCYSPQLCFPLFSLAGTRKEEYTQQFLYPCFLAEQGQQRRLLFKEKKEQQQKQLPDEEQRNENFSTLHESSPVEQQQQQPQKEVEEEPEDYTHRVEEIQGNVPFHPAGGTGPVRPLSLLDEETEILRDAVRKFAQAEIEPRVQAMEDAETIDSDVIESLFKQGYLALEVGENFGGSGMSFLQSLIVIEEIARVDPAVAALVDIHNTLVNRCLVAYGTKEQQSKYLPQLCHNMLGSFCLSEDESGSDAFALKMRAHRGVSGSGSGSSNSSTGWILKGSKQWISTAKEAGLFIVFATVDPDKGYKGITAFLVDGKSQGLHVGTPLQKLGIKASSTCPVHLDNIEVADDCVLGEIGKGYKIAISLLNEGRIGIAAQMLGLAKSAFDTTTAYLCERKQFGHRIMDFQGVRFQCAEFRKPKALDMCAVAGCKTTTSSVRKNNPQSSAKSMKKALLHRVQLLSSDIEAAQLLTYNAALLRETGRPFTKEAAIAKLVTSRVAQKVSSACVDLLGGNGFTRDYGVEKLYRDSKIGSIYEGTSNILLETIAKQLQRKHASLVA